MKKFICQWLSLFVFYTPIAFAKPIPPIVVDIRTEVDPASSPSVWPMNVVIKSSINANVRLHVDIPASATLISGKLDQNLSVRAGVPVTTNFELRLSIPLDGSVRAIVETGDEHQSFYSANDELVLGSVSSRRIAPRGVNSKSHEIKSNGSNMIEYRIP